MKETRKLSNCIFSIFFGFILLFFGTTSSIKLINYYVNDVVGYNEWKPELGNKFETDLASTFYQKIQFVNLNGAIRNFLHQPEMNGVVKLDNGYLLSPMEYCSDDIISEFVANTVTLNEYMHKRGTTLVYASTPYTCSKYDPQLPDGIEDYGNNNIDRLLEGLRNEGVDTIDFRQEMHDDGISQYDMMYRTDHHWTSEAGLYAYGVLEKYIQEQTKCVIDPRISDINNYTVNRYKKWHLGSNGQRTGIFYAGIDDFDLIIPNFETRLRNADGAEGSMQDLMINTDPLRVKDYTSRYTYDFVLGNTLGNYQNLDACNDIKLLVITDSFGRAVNQYLAMGFKEIRFVHDEDVSSVTPDFIEAYDPDLVIMLYYPNVIRDDSVSFGFNGF